MEYKSRVSGIADLDKTFLALPRTTQRRALIPAMREVAKGIRDKASVNVKAVATKGYATGLLSRSLRVYTYRKYRGYFRVAVSIKRGLVNTKKIVKGQPVRVGLYGAVLEYGKNGQAPQSWIRKAIRESRSTAVSELAKESSRRMVDAVREARSR